MSLTENERSLTASFVMCCIFMELLIVNFDVIRPVQGYRTKMLNNFIFILVQWLFIPCVFSAKLVKLQITLQDEPFETEAEFLSFCLDPYLKHDLPVPWGNLSFDNPKVLTLARGLSPAILRWGGTDADWSVFYPKNDSLNDHGNLKKFDYPGMKSNVVFNMKQDDFPKGFVVPIYQNDVDNLRKLAHAAGGKLLYDLNIQQRKGDDWDPSNAKKILKYISDTTNTDTVKDVVIELGNEWPYPQYRPTPQRLAQDFLELKKTLDTFSKFSKSYIVGPDIGTENGIAESFWSPIVKEFTKTVGSFARALTIHHYYFKGPGADISAYFDLKYYDGLGDILVAVRRVMNEAGGQKLPLWIGETSDSYSKGTPGITNTFAGGFLWLDKLGLAAKLGVSLVARQDFYGGNYPFLNENLDPNPDYWASYVFKHLMGTKVLSYNNTAIDKYTRVYAHCTAQRAGYEPGSVTVMLLNLGDLETLPFYFSQSQDVYVYTLKGEGSLIASTVLLNGKRLQLVNDNTLPSLDPVKRKASDGVVFSEKSMNFIVLNDANFEYCNS